MSASYNETELAALKFIEQTPKMQEILKELGMEPKNLTQGSFKWWKMVLIAQKVKNITLETEIRTLAKNL